MPTASWELCRGLKTRSALQARSRFFAFARQRESVVEPGEAAEHVVFGPIRGGRVAHVPRNPLRMVERPQRAGFKLHARGAQQARGCVAPKRRGEIVLRRSMAADGKSRAAWSKRTQSIPRFDGM